MSVKTEEKSTFENNLIALVVHRKPHCIVEYEVKASKHLCMQAQKTAAKTVGKDVAVPGFRKGKAPVEIVTKRYPQKLDKCWQETIANWCYRECAQLAHIPLATQETTISFNMLSHDCQGAHLTLTFETIPSVPTIDPAQCILKEVKRAQVTQENVDEMLRQVQMFFGKWEKVEDRPVKEGDFILLNVLDIDKDPPETLFPSTRFEVADRSMAKWMKALVLGRSPNDVVEGVSTPDEDVSDEEKNNYPPKKVQLTIRQIDQVELPVLDDDFAKKVGVPDVAALQQRIEELLKRNADEHFQEQQRDQVIHFLLSHHFELPRSTVLEETKLRVKLLEDEPKTKKKWEACDQKGRQAWVDRIRLEAEKAVRLLYLCRKIAADQNIDISIQDDQSHASDPLDALLFPTAERAQNQSTPEVKRSEAYVRLLLAEVADWMIAHARTALPNPGSVEGAPINETAVAEQHNPTGQEKKTHTPRHNTGPSSETSK